MSVREVTNKVLELAEAGVISWRDLTMMCLKWMPEDDVADMLRANDVTIDEEMF
jgi:hypothetical protein